MSLSISLLSTSSFPGMYSLSFLYSSVSQLNIPSYLLSLSFLLSPSCTPSLSFTPLSLSQHPFLSSLPIHTIMHSLTFLSLSQHPFLSSLPIHTIMHSLTFLHPFVSISTSLPIFSPYPYHHALSHFSVSISTSLPIFSYSIFTIMHSLSLTFSSYIPHSPFLSSLA